MQKAEWNATQFLEELDMKIKNEEVLHQMELGKRDLAMVSAGLHLGKMQAYEELKELLEKLFKDNAVEGE
jgi:hypothetical protein